MKSSSPGLRASATPGDYAEFTATLKELNPLPSELVSRRKSTQRSRSFVAATLGCMIHPLQGCRQIPADQSTRRNPTTQSRSILRRTATEDGQVSPTAFMRPPECRLCLTRDCDECRQEELETRSDKV